MNSLNSKLYRGIVTISVALVALCMIFTLIHLMNQTDQSVTPTFDIAIFFPNMAKPVSEMYILVSQYLPSSIWDPYSNFINMYAGVLENVLDTATSIMILVVAGFAMMVFGMISPQSKNCKGPKDDPREYIFTHRKNGLLKAFLMPWNAIPMFWKYKYIPVIIPIILLPLTAPFAIMATVATIVFYVLFKLLMSAKIKTAAARDRDHYDRAVGIAICPKCKRTFRQPKFKCKCGVIFDYPVPDIHGIKEHTCNKGHSIPCTNANGARGRLNFICPFCEQEIPLREAKPMVVSMVGAVGSGKSAMMVSATESIVQKAKAKGIMTEVPTHGIALDKHNLKDVIPPTVTGELDSECVFIWARDMDAKEIIFNDISGAEFEPNENREIFQDYYKYTDGFIFAIDPMAVMAFYNSDSPIKSNKTTVSGTYESFYNVFTLVNGYGPSTVSSVPMAVVLTKMDNPRVATAVKSAGSPEAFLAKYGEGNFVKNIGHTFSDVKYFAVSSMGQDANSIEPVMWIVEHKDPALVRKLE